MTTTRTAAEIAEIRSRLCAVQLEGDRDHAVLMKGLSDAR